MKNDPQFKNFQNIFFRIINKSNELLKKPLDYGTGEVLSPSEMEAIDIIGRHPGINVTGLALRLGVTKGAVSQSIKKLEAKRLIQRVDDPNNGKSVLLQLEKKGITAFECHERFHEKYDAFLKEELKTLTGDQMALVEECLLKIEKAVDHYAGALG